MTDLTTSPWLLKALLLTQQMDLFFVEDFILRDLANFNEAKETMSFFSHNFSKLPRHLKV